MWLLNHFAKPLLQASKRLLAAPYAETLSQNQHCAAGLFRQAAAASVQRCAGRRNTVGCDQNLAALPGGVPGHFLLQLLAAAGQCCLQNPAHGQSSNGSTSSVSGSSWC